MRYVLILVALSCVACGDNPLSPSPVCTTEYHALDPVVQATPTGYILVDSGPLTPVTVCRKP